MADTTCECVECVECVKVCGYCVVRCRHHVWSMCMSECVSTCKCVWCVCMVCVCGNVQTPLSPVIAPCPHGKGSLPECCSMDDWWNEKSKSMQDQATPT